MKPAPYRILAILMLLCLSLVWGATPAPARPLVLEHGDQTVLAFDPAKMEAKSPAFSLKIKPEKQRFLLILGAEGYLFKPKGNQYKLYHPDGSLVFKIKVKPGKVKILRGEKDPAPWAIKPKDDGLRYKVKKGEQKLGKVQYYPNRQKLKVKDKDGGEQCVARYDGLALAPAVCLFSELSEKQRLLLFTCLSLMESREAG